MKGAVLLKMWVSQAWTVLVSEMVFVVICITTIFRAVSLALWAVPLMETQARKQSEGKPPGPLAVTFLDRRAQWYSSFSGTKGFGFRRGRSESSDRDCRIFSVCKELQQTCTLEALLKLFGVQYDVFLCRVMWITINNNRCGTTRPDDINC